MSHFLHTTNKMEGKCILSIPCKQVVPPRYRKILRESQSLNHRSKEDQYQQEVILRHLCSKLTNKQLFKLKRENEINMREELKKLKRRMRETCKGSSSEIIKYFEQKNEKQNISSVLKSQIENIQLGTKYQSKIINKLMAIKQINQIEQNKQQYRRWFNSNNNSPLKSPNYKKMNYLIQKINKGQKISSSHQHDYVMLKNQQRILPRNENELSNTQNDKPLPKQQRCSDKTGMNPIIAQKMCQQDYSRKSKFNNFRIKLL